MSGEEAETVVTKVHDHLRELAHQMREQQISANKYTIYTQLGKEPKDYPNGASMPAVQVALKLLSRGKRVKAKDVMSFIICGSCDGKADIAASNAYPVDEVLSSESGLLPDIDYYLHKQILPPVERLCAPIQGTNVTLLAECLGLDTSKYRVQSSSSTGQSLNNQHEIFPLESQIPDHIRFKDCSPFLLLCPTCRTRFSFSGLIPLASPSSSTCPEATISASGLSCPNISCSRPSLPFLSLTSQLESTLRSSISTYYSSWVKCDEPTCTCPRTRSISVYGHRCLGPKLLAHGCQGRVDFETGAKSIYNQLLYLYSLFDMKRCEDKITKIKLEGDDRHADNKEEKVSLVQYNRTKMDTCASVVQGYLDKSGWGWVDMRDLFRGVFRDEQ